MNLTLQEDDITKRQHYKKTGRRAYWTITSSCLVSQVCFCLIFTFKHAEMCTNNTLDWRIHPLVKEFRPIRLFIFF